MIPEHQKKITHLKIGRLLLQQTSSYALEERIFDIVNQLNIGRELIPQSSEKEKLAQLNLKAGKKAKAATAYEAAAKYLAVGLELLPENSWQSHYQITLNLYGEAAEPEYLNTNFERAEQLVETVLEQAKILLDKVRIYELKIQFAYAQNQLSQAVETGLQIIEMLVISLSSLTNDATGVPQLPQLDELANIAVMTDVNQLAAMRIFMNISSAAVNSGDYTTFIQIILTMVNLCLKQGHSALAAFAYADYGMILSGAIGDLDGGYHSGQIALRLLEQFNAREIKSKVYAPLNGLIRHWKESARVSLLPLLEGIQSGLDTGDYEYAAICACHYSYLIFWVGDSLEFVAQKQAVYIDLMQKLKQVFFRNYIKLYHQLTLNLQGLTDDKLRLIGSSFNEETQLPELLATNNALLFFVYFFKGVLCYLFKDYAQSNENIKLAQNYLATATGSLALVNHNFYYSLSLLAGYNNLDVTEQQQYLSQFEENQQKMQQWASHAPFNYQHKYELVEAEKARVLGDILQAQEYYDRAITGAKNNGYIQDEALANELAAEFYLASGRKKIAKAYMTDAYYGYIRWGAEAKVKDLDERYPELIFRSFRQETTDIETTRTTHSTRTTNSTASGSSVLDVVSVIKAAQTLSSEIVLDELLRKLMTILLENAGASKGCLLLQRQDAPFIEVSATGVEREAVVVQSVSPTNELLPLSLIHYVMRSLENIVLNNAAGDSNFTSDPYIQQHQPKSVVCFPILNQGKLMGILYLENNVTIGAFTKERIEILRVLCFQTAISLENAFLYGNLEQANHQL